MAEGLPDPSLPSASESGTRVKEKALPKLPNLLSPIVHSWALFARQIGVPSTQISLIRAANPVPGPNYLYTCFTETLEWWVNNHHNPTYEAIIAILDPERGQTTPVMNRTLAEQVRKFMAKQQQAVRPPIIASSTHGDLGGQEEFGNVQEETFQQPRSNECQLNVSSQGLDEGLSPPSKPQELDILSSVPQEDKINTVTNTSVPIEPSPDEFGKVQEETFQQLHSDECSVSSQGLDEGPSSSSKPQELDTLSSMPQEDEVNTATNTPVPVEPLAFHHMPTLQVKPQHEDAGNTQPTPASQVFRQYYADMVEAIQDPDTLTAELYSAKIILSSTRDEATQSHLTRQQKNAKLLPAVECQLSTNPEAFKVFLSALRKRKPLVPLCKRMEEAYSQPVTVELLSSAVSASTSEPNSFHQSQALPSVSKSEPNFFSGSVVQSHSSNDSTVFPYLIMTGMTEQQEHSLQRRLLKDTNTIISKFSHVWNYTIESLKDNPDVTVETLSSRVCSFGAYKPVYAQKPLLRDKLKEIGKCTTIDGVFFILSEYCSFFNYGIIQNIVTWFGKPADKARLEEYTEHFKNFCKRRIAECPPNVYGHKSESRSNLVLKTEDSWDPRGETQGKTLQQVLDLENFVIEVLGFEPETLHLCRIGDGCVELLFQVPSFVEEDIFPLSMEQERALTSVGMARLTCGSYKFPPEVSDILSHLPPEITVMILQYLDSLDLCQFPLVCRGWYQLLSQNHKFKTKRDKYLKLRKLSQEQLSVLLKYRQLDTKIGIVYSDRHLQKAVAIAEHLRSKKIPTHLLKYDHWLERANEHHCTHFVISIAKMMPWSVLDDHYMESIKPSTVVAVLQGMPVTIKNQPQRHQFLQLDFRETATWLAEAALAYFAAPLPKAYEEDNCYWSDEPELVDIWREEDSQLSDTVTIGEMAPDSPFGTITLTKPETIGVFHDKLGPHTHIQSINGILLDGKEKVAEIFKCLTHPRMQLMVRVIHSVDISKLRQLPNRPSIPIDGPSSPEYPSNSTSEVLPTPLFLLGDNVSLQNEMFELLSSKYPLPEEMKTDDNRTSLRLRNLLEKLSESDKCIERAVVPMNKFKVDISSLDLNQPRLFQRPPDTHPQAKVQQFSDFKSTHGSPSPASHSTSPTLSLDSEIISDEKNSTDIEIQSLEPSSEHSEIHTSKLEPSSEHSEINTSKFEKPKVNRQLDLRPPIDDQQFILHMLKKDMDRQFMHIFFKSSGVYLVVLELDNVLDDPLIQYEKLFYWLRLIQTHVRPDELKRVIVIGVYYKSKVQECSDLFLQCIKHLNTAIQDHMKQHFRLPTEEKGFVLHLPIQEKGFIFLFDLENAQLNLQYLCACIKCLMDVHMDQAWSYFRQEYFESIFLPSKNYQTICIQLSQLGERKVVQSSKTIRGHVGDSLPCNVFKTLAAYATQCISSTGAALLCPSFIPELLTTFTRRMIQQMHMSLPPSLKSLPIVNSSLLSARIAELGVVEHEEQELLIEWLKQFEFAYSLGKVGSQETFFVPFLATETQSDNAIFKWDDDLEARFDGCPLVLYALLHIPATEHFYHRLIASLLSDAIKSPQFQPCYINRCSNGAIMPLQYEEHNSPQNNFLFKVLVKYHTVQNIIEFKAREREPLMLLKAVETKLFDTFNNSKYHSVFDFKGAFTFHIPADDFEQTLKEGAIWKLGNIDGDYDHGAMDYNRRESVLLKTKFLVQLGYDIGSPQLRAWASLFQGTASNEDIPEANAFWDQFPELVGEIQYPNTLAVHLYAKKVISLEVLEAVGKETLTIQQKTRKLLQCVYNSIVCIDPKLFWVFVEILQQEPSSQTLVKNLKLKYEKFGSGGVTVQQPHSDECNISSQGLDEGLSPPSKRQKLNTLSSRPQDIYTATDIPVSTNMPTSQGKPQQEDVSNTWPTNSASQIFRQYYADMVKAIQGPNVLAVELYSAEIIHKTNRDEVTLTTLTTEQKNIKLLAAVQSHLLVNPSSFEVFLSALKKQKPLASLVLCERMEEAYLPPATNTPVPTTERMKDRMLTGCTMLEELLSSVPEETLQKPCSDEHIVEIASEALRWKCIASHLQLSEIDVEDIETYSPKDAPSQRIKMLKTWKDKFGAKATYKVLASAIYKDKQVHLVEKIVTLLKEEATDTSSLEPRPSPRKRQKRDTSLSNLFSVGAQPIPVSPKQYRTEGLEAQLELMIQRRKLPAKPTAPLRFHESRHGISVCVAEDGMRVQHSSESTRASYSVALTNRPLRSDEMFEIEILKRPIMIPPVGLALGVTIHCPDKMNCPMYAYEYKTGTWMVDWQGRPDRQYVVMVNGKEVYRNFVSLEILRSLKTATYVPIPPQKGSSPSAIMSRLQPKYRKAAPGDTVALCVTKKRELAFFINGEKKGIVATDISGEVYGFVELMHTYLEIELVSHDTPPVNV